MTAVPVQSLASHPDLELPPSLDQGAVEVIRAEIRGRPVWDAITRRTQDAEGGGP
jgi:hypothetical protein